MKKIIFQFVVLVALFFGLWFALSSINWMSAFKIEKLTDDTEIKIGKTVWDLYKKTEKENKDEKAVNAIDSIVDKICSKNNINRETIKVHIIIKNDINAFAMPGGHLVVYSGLITASDNPDELAGVLAHEISHIQLGHVMKKLIKEVGLSVLISMTSGNSGGETIKQVSKILSSSAFDRKLEKEADISAVEYLINANINPEPLAEFLYKLAENKKDETSYESWLSTHPDSKKRAEYILAYSKNKLKNPQTALSDTSWKILKENAAD
jgi:Zn-dependent protease with chaperone function